MPRNRQSFEDGKNDGSQSDWADNRRWKEDADYRWGHEEGQKERKAEKERQEREEAKYADKTSRDYQATETSYQESSTKTNSGGWGSILLALMEMGMGMGMMQYGDNSGRLVGLLFIITSLVWIGFVIYKNQKQQ